MLVDTHHNDPEQSAALLLPFTAALFDHLSLFDCQMRVVTLSVTDPAMLVRRHELIMHPSRQSDAGSGSAVERHLVECQKRREYAHF